MQSYTYVGGEGFRFILSGQKNETTANARPLPLPRRVAYVDIPSTGKTRGETKMLWMDPSPVRPFPMDKCWVFDVVVRYG